MASIDIKGIDKAALLAALYNNAKPMGMGALQARPGVMTREDAMKAMFAGDDGTRMFGETLGRGPDKLYFDYLYGRPLKVNLEGDVLETSMYNRDWGKDAAEKIVQSLRDAG